MSTNQSRYTIVLWSPTWRAHDKLEELEQDVERRRQAELDVGRCKLTLEPRLESTTRFQSLIVKKG